jgi:hypothetical protein
MTKKGVKMNLNFNNKGLKKMFTGTIVTRKKLQLGELNGEFLTSSIKSTKEFQYDYERFEIDDLELEGQFNDWTLNIKLNVM